MYRIFSGKPHFLQPVLGRVESLIYRLGKIDSSKEMSWRMYLFSLLLFQLFGFLFLFLILIFQGILPLNPSSFAGLNAHLAFNVAVSFVTNTNWQSYCGESTLSYFSQMVGLAVQNFLSAATGVVVFLALTRGLVRKTARTLGNFWVDLTRCILYLLLPLAAILAILLVSQGVIQNFTPSIQAVTLEGKEQLLPMGPVASQIAVKQLGTNGGGYFGANSAHPFENPTPISNFLQLLSILLIPVALTHTYGRMTGNIRQGWFLFISMFILFQISFLVAAWAEIKTEPALIASALHEGKEWRFSTASSILWSVATTAASNGSVNCMHDSMSPLAGGVQIINMLLGEIIFGGVGAGLYGILMFVIITVFIAGLLVGRSPEFLGKKLEIKEVKWAIVAILLPSVVVLIGTALSLLIPQGVGARTNVGPHGLSEILYGWASAIGNNGSAFAGLSANSLFYNLGLGIAMLIGRYGVIVPALIIAGSLVEKKETPPSSGTFATDSWTFSFLLMSVILIIGGLTFLPVLYLGPVLEHLLMFWKV